MLLEMHLIHGPKIHLGFSCQSTEFFYAQLGVPGWLGLLAAAACADESRADGTAADIVALSASPRVLAGDRRTRSVRPTSAWSGHTALDWRGARSPLWPVGVHSIGWVGPPALVRTSRPAPAIQTVAPNSPQCAANRPDTPRPAGR